jgi:hypothetical protein
MIAYFDFVALQALVIAKFVAKSVLPLEKLLLFKTSFSA